MSCHARSLYLLPALVLLLIAAGCGEQKPEEEEGTKGQNGEKNGAAEQNGEKDNGEQAKEPSADVKHARALWAEIKEYSDWTQPEGFEGWNEGKSPHGAVLRYYVNAVAEGDLTKDGAVIVKENYSEQSEDALKSVTVMQKRQGYDPETGNWFYVKYAPDGTVLSNPKGKKLAGLVGKGADKGCVPCHAAAAGDDYLFMND